MTRRIFRSICVVALAVNSRRSCSFLSFSVTSNSVSTVPTRLPSDSTGLALS